MARSKKVSRIFWLVILIAALAAGGWYWFGSKNGDEGKTSYRLAKVERGTIVSSVSSTGTLSAVTTVQVGSQVSGQIKELMADFNSEVEENQVIARIDPEDFQAKLRQAQAEVAVSQANLINMKVAIDRAAADISNAEAALASAKAQTSKAAVAVEDSVNDYKRQLALFKKHAVSESQVEDAQAAMKQAEAQRDSAKAQELAAASNVGSKRAALKMAYAQVDQAKATLEMRQALLHQAEVNLGHTIIKSPVKGTVIKRSVDIGQTVAASLQAPELFTIAKDLRQMQVETNVDEADIGRIDVDQKADFTVDAYPGDNFKGRVAQIRKSPQTLQNVVTYTVIISADNPELKLLPGMTANVTVLVDERSNALKVPNAALRFKPRGTEPAGDSAGKSEPTQPGPGGRRASGQQILERLTKGLDLSKDQQDRIKEIFVQNRQKILGMRDKGASPEDIKAEATKMRQNTGNLIMTDLTDEQRAKCQAFIRARAKNPVTPGQVWALDSSGQPQALDIMTGISDGNFTEVVRGGLEPGREIITGIDRRKSK